MKNNRYRLHQLLVHCMVLLPAIAYGQVIITPGASLAAEGNPIIAIKTDKDIVNENAFDFSSTQLSLELFSGTQSLSGNLFAHQLDLAGGTIKTVNGNLTVTNGINFTLGLLESGNAGKILYTGPAENLINASESSHVNGIFHTQASGSLFFPVGAEGIGYAPAWLENGNGSEVAVSVVPGPAGFTFDPGTSELQTLDNSRYWHVAGDLAGLNSRITLSLNGIAGFGNDLTPVVVQSDNTGGTGDNLQGLGENERVTSRKAISKPLVAVGGSKEVLLVIYDLITPFSAGHNDELKIENIEHFPTNKVTLLDRWGAPVKQWINFTNYDDDPPNQDGYDFKQLSPGNYICIVEYGDAETGMRKKSQMISVLKAK